MSAVNYATLYGRALANAYPYQSYFGKLRNIENNSKFRWLNAKTIEIPTLTTKGAVNADNDTITTAVRRWDNSWEPKEVKFHREWSTLLAPTDVDMTNQVATIQNITSNFNEFHKFPEKDAYLVSKLYKDLTALDVTAKSEDITAANILALIDKELEDMQNKRVPVNGSIMYLTPALSTLLKGVMSRYLNSTDSTINRTISRIEQLELVIVPEDLMRTEYDFTEDWAVKSGALYINYFIVHPSAIITPEVYTFAQLDQPSAMSNGKYVYYEERYEDVFILNERKDAIRFHASANPLGKA
ncbi:MAG: capsid protein [Candidatus Coproplasma sp.]